jgi:uncharacterized membrane protein
MLAPVLILLAAGSSSNVTLLSILLAIGVLVAVFGHIIHSRALILAGILVIGVVSAYFSFVLQPGS